MLNISLNLETGQARLAQTTAIKAGGVVPVIVTFNAPPGDDLTLEVALIPQSTTRTVLAYLSTFEPENDRTFQGDLDANDARLIAHIAEKNLQNVALDVEVAVESDSFARRILPNMPVTVQKPGLTGPASSEGGPTYFTREQSNGRFVAGRTLTVPLTANADSVEVDLSPLGLAEAPTAILASVASRGAIVAASPDLLTLTSASVTVRLSAAPGAGAQLTLLVIPQ